MRARHFRFWTQRQLDRLGIKSIRYGDKATSKWVVTVRQGYKNMEPGLRLASVLEVILNSGSGFESEGGSGQGRQYCRT